MSFDYSPESRGLQDRYDTRRLADRLAEVNLHDRFTEADLPALLSAAPFQEEGQVNVQGVPDLTHSDAAKAVHSGMGQLFHLRTRVSAEARHLFGSGWNPETYRWGE
jgi:hypothetical protein